MNKQKSKPDSSLVRKFHALLYRTHMLEVKQDLLAGHRVESTLDLTNEQLRQLIDYLQGLDNSKKEENLFQIRSWRHKVLRKVSECGIDTQDWNEVNKFITNPRIAGKHLYECTLEELKSLHRKLHNVAIEKEKKKQLEQKLAMMN